MATGITFSPDLSQSKAIALRNTNYLASTKVILVFEETFWEEDPDSPTYMGGKMLTDLPLKVSYYPSTPSKSGNHRLFIVDKYIKSANTNLLRYLLQHIFMC